MFRFVFIGKSNNGRHDKIFAFFIKDLLRSVVVSRGLGSHLLMPMNGGLADWQMAKICVLSCKGFCICISLCSYLTST